MTDNAKNIIRITLLFALLLIPIFFAMFTAIDLEYSWMKKLAYFVVVTVLLLLPALFLRARAYFIIEGIFNFFFFPIDIASLYLNRQSTSTAFLLNIFHTDIHESMELLIAIWPVCIVVIALWILYFVLAARVENEYLLPHIFRKIVIVGLPILFVVGIITMTIHLSRLHNEQSLKSVIPDAVELVWMKLYKIYPYNLYLECADIIQMQNTQRRLQEQVASFSFGIQPRQADGQTLYVLVMGEASRYDHWHINGYERPTSPCLEQCDNILSFDSAYSQANLTSYSVPLILTRATADNADIAYKEKTLPEAFQEAGYHVGFLTKQIPSNLTQRVMNVCDDAYFYSKGIDVEDNFDEEMVETLAHLTLPKQQFFVLHSLGCHFRYELRYPESFAQFQPTFGTSFSYSMISEKHKEQLINAYDNAILYTDYFLSNLIHYMDSLDCPAVMMYISDHGESFWDDERKLSLHGSYEISEYEYHVPLFIWYSDEYAALHAKKIEAMRQNITTPVSSDVVFYSLLDLAGIDEIVTPHHSICSPTLQAEDSIWVHVGSGETKLFTPRHMD